MRILQTLALSSILVTAGCATATTKPITLEQPAVAAATPIHISDVIIEAKDGIWMSDNDHDYLRQKILAHLDVQARGSDHAAPTTDYAMHVQLTRFDKGNAFARLALIGLGQIHIEATITLVDAQGAQHGQYKVVKTYAMGGLAGGLTSASDVEEGFAKSVAAIVSPKH